MSLSLIFRYIARDVYQYEKPIEQYEDFHNFVVSDTPIKVCKNFKTRIEYRLNQLKSVYNISEEWKCYPFKLAPNDELLSEQCILRYYVTFNYKRRKEHIILTISAFKIGGSTLVSYYYE